MTTTTADTGRDHRAESTDGGTGPGGQHRAPDDGTAPVSQHRAPDDGTAPGGQHWAATATAGLAPDRVAWPPPTADPAPIPPPGATGSGDGGDTGPPPPGTRGGRWAHGFVRGRAGDPAWVRPWLLALLGATAVLLLWGLSASGWANSFYAAAAQAGSVSWKAFFFGSSDAGNAITVDKPPASLWIMALSVRAFGLNSWALLVPQALMGVATVGMLYLTVRRWAGAAAGLLAGTVLALTPVAVLMFRYDNPDALLTLVLVSAAYAVVRAVEAASWRWLALAGALVGLGFLTKMLQALLVLPAFALVYLLATDTPLRRRLAHVLAAAAALLVSAGWWVAVVELTPTSLRPYIGGSQNNSVLDLIIGYNGLGRLTGDETGSVGGGNGWGQTGLFRLFDAENGGQISWLLPAALILLVAGLWLTWRAPRTDRTRAGLLLWGGWLVVTGLVFSLMQGIFHPYYSVVLGPAVGAVVAIGAAAAWRRRSELAARIVLATAVAVSAWWGSVLLHRTPQWHPWLAILVLVGGFAAAASLLAVDRLRRAAAVGVAGAAVAAVLAAPAAYAVSTAATPHTGAIPSAGPTVAGAGFGGGPGGRTGGFAGGFGTRGGTGTTGGQNPFGGTGSFPGQTQGSIGGQTGRAGGTGGGGAVGGLLNAGSANATLVTLLEQGAGDFTWVAAAVGSNSAATYQLATQAPVMAIGGFNGTDPSPTLAEFQADVAAGKIHYFIASGGGMGGGAGGMGGMAGQGSSGTAQAITAWIEANFTAKTVGGVTVYDLTASSGSSG